MRFCEVLQVTGRPEIYNGPMNCVDTELNMPGSLRALGTSEFPNTFIHELMRNVSDSALFDAALDMSTAEEGGFYCSIARVVRDGDLVTVTVDFEFGAASSADGEAHGKFDIALDLEQQRAYVID